MIMSTQRTRTLMATTYCGAYDSAQLSFLHRREFRHFRTTRRRETATAAHAANNNSSIQLASSTLGGITKSWGFDKLDNATNYAGVTGTYNGLNQIATFNAVSYTCHANGNLSSDGADRLKTITQGATTVTFAYDGLGRRLKQTASATETRYLWCGPAICQQRNGSDTAAKRFYSEGEYVHSGTKKYLTLTDHLGSVRDVIDITGTPTLVRSLDYRPYCATARSWGSVNTGYTYAVLFAQTNMTLLLSTTRAYNPANGKWLNVDPKREGGGVNLYGYSNGSPIMLFDPQGMKGQPSSPIDSIQLPTTPGFGQSTGNLQCLPGSQDPMCNPSLPSIQQPVNPIQKPTGPSQQNIHCKALCAAGLSGLCAGYYISCSIALPILGQTSLFCPISGGVYCVACTNEASRCADMCPP